MVAMESDETNTLRARYPVVEQTVTATGRTWTLSAVTDQDALIRRVESDADLEQFPYGLMLWASALGLAERLGRDPAEVTGRRVLEIGAGVGLAGIVARWLGAEVTQTDYQEEALTLCRVNAARNGVSGIRHTLGDWRDWPAALTGFDQVIGSDVLYERSLHGTLAALLPRLVAPGGSVLLSDPLRPQALEFVEGLERAGAWSVTMEGAAVPWEGNRKDLALFTLLKR